MQEELEIFYWIRENPVLCSLMLSNTLMTTQIEHLFEYFKGNITWLTGFESYIKGQLMFTN